ncbi:MAG: NAD(P)H-binding protein [Woeseia sp.]|nr:NAD(P)H-binding protein [Woeseia sp.]NNE61475.1 NAD(P)H-binding protein [Woeseia sp.]NNL55226.1 NAD(P)H-binding protein [Woeseia sp.]
MSNPDSKRRALVVGATGLVGGQLLDKLARHPAYESIATLGRNTPAASHNNLQHFKFGEPDADQAFDTDVVFCCLGTTIRQAGSDAAFRAVDVDLVVDIAKRAQAAGVATFIVVSSLGADAGSRNFYLRIKGEMEQGVVVSGPPRVGIIRPALLIGQRDAFRPVEAAWQKASHLINPFLFGALRRYRSVDANDVADAMIGLDLSTFTGSIFVESDQLSRYSGRSDPQRQSR